MEGPLCGGVQGLGVVAVRRDGVHERVGGLGGDEMAVHAVGNHILDALEAGGDGGGAALPGFEQHDPESLHVVLDGHVGHHEQVGPAVEGAQGVVRNPAQEADARSQVVPRDGGLDRVELGAVAGDPVVNVGGEAGHHGVDEPGRALTLDLSSHAAEQEPVGWGGGG